jgi:hypothetical protein
MCLYTICKGYRKSLGPKLKKTFPLCRGPLLALGKGALCREPEWPALGKGCWPGPSFSPRDICRVLAQALGKGLLFAESLTARLSAKVTTTRVVHGATPLPRACLCRELNPRQSFPLPRGWLCRELSRRQSLFAECPYWLSANLGSRQSSRFL